MLIFSYLCLLSISEFIWNSFSILFVYIKFVYTKFIDLSQEEKSPLPDFTRPLYRSVGNYNRMISGFLFNVKRRKADNSTTCKESHKKKSPLNLAKSFGFGTRRAGNFSTTDFEHNCQHIELVANDSYGIDPAFVASSQLYREYAVDNVNTFYPDR